MSEPTLIEDIAAQAETDFDSGRTNHLSDLACAYGGIVASFAAAILAVMKDGPPPVAVAVVAGVPGLCAALQRVIDFRGRAEWYFIKAAELKGIALSLQHEGLAEAEGSRKYRELTVTMERQWTHMGRGRRAQSGPQD